MKKILVLSCIVVSILIVFPYCTIGEVQENKNTESEIIEQLDTEVPIVEENLEFDINTDYSELMIGAICDGNAIEGKEYERLRNMKKECLNIEDSFSFNELLLLSKIVEVEAGSSWITNEHKRLVASVVINRVNSPEFPDSIDEVIYQQGQYSGVRTERFKNLIPSYSSVKNAAFVLTNGSIAPGSVVFQANFPQGSGIYKTFTPDKLGTTYFCYSSNVNLYE